MSFELLLEEIASNVKTILDEDDSGDVNFQVSPAKPGFGDASCNAPFLLAKRLGKNPREIADDLAKSYSKFTGGLVANASAHPSGYLNFEADWEKLGTLVLQNSIKPEYGSGTQNGKITLEHTSVNCRCISVYHPDGSSRYDGVQGSADTDTRFARNNKRCI